MMPFEEWMNIEVMFDSKAKIAQVRPELGRSYWTVLTREETEQLFGMVDCRLKQEEEEG